MTDRHTTGPQQDATGHGLSVGDAARQLGVTPDAVRAKLHRGTLLGSKVDGTWRVFLDPPAIAPDQLLEERTVDRQAAPGTPTVTDGTRQPADRQPTADLLDHLRGEITYLRGQLADRSRELAAERERSDVIQREAIALNRDLLEQMQALGAGDAATRPEFDESTARQDATGRDRQSDPPDSSQGTTARSWWRRLVGVR